MSEKEGTSLVKTNANYKLPVLSGIKNLPVWRQMGVITALALASALGLAAVLWMQKPDYGLLYGSLSDKEVGGVLETLEKLNVDYKIDTATGAILAPADKIHEVRLKLAAQGLPKSSNLGYELLDQETGYGTSQALETARFQRALEGEIARSVMVIQPVRSARVHLALPKQSVFVRERKQPSASVLVDLYPGRSLEKSQVEAIVHLVASSVPQMEAGQVTVVDQKGRLLNAKENGDAFFLTSKQFEYKTQVEEHLMERVRNILSPLVGPDGLRAQVSADLDFSVTEKTQEAFNPELSAVRSEQTSEELSRLNGIGGIPGALSNQPPAAGVAPETAAGQTPATAQTGEPGSSSKSATRNFELDKTISHTRLAGGELRRLTVAVVVDNQRLIEDGKEASRPYSQADLDRFADLVKQAVGFDAKRADQVTVTNAAFLPPEPLEPLPEPPLWEQGWFTSLLKQIGAVLVVVFLVFGVFRPALRALTPRQQARVPAAGGGAQSQTGDDELAEDRLTLSKDEMPLLDAPPGYDKRLAFAKKMVDENPQRVAQVVKAWVRSDG